MPRAPLVLALLCLTISTALGDEGALGVYVRGPERMVPGTTAALRIGTHLAPSPESSQPLGGVTLEVALAGGGKRALLWRGASTAAGTAEAKFQVPGWPVGRYQVVVTGQAGARRQTVTQEIELGAVGRLLLSSDKPLYQPGQTIHLRGLALRSQDGRPLAGDVTVELSDPRGNRVFYVEQKLSEFGVTTADFPLADDLGLGTYTARLTVGEETAELPLRIERYTLPRFKITLTPDQGYYRQGEKLRVAVDGRYFFGKPVAGAEVTVKVRLRDPDWRNLATLRGKLDAAGKVALDVELPAKLTSDAASVRLIAQVVDPAGFRQDADREVPLARNALALEVVPEAGVLRPDLEQRIWVVVGRPDGTSAAGADVELTFDGGPPTRARTDALGVAELTTRPPAAKGDCLKATVAVGLAGDRIRESRCLKVGMGRILVRTDRAIHDTATPLAVDVIAPGATSAWVDVIKDDQVVDGASVLLQGGQGRMTFPISQHLGGTLVIHAYPVGPDGRAGDGDARLVYLAPPSSLRVELHPATYRPGEAAKLELRVVDARSGSGVRASVGVAMVDQAVLALRAERAGSTRVLLTLGEAAAHAADRLRVRPGGLGVLELVEELRADAGRQRAARILLASAAPERSGFEIDPWNARHEAWEAQRTKLGQAVTRWVVGHVAGERVGGKWVWRHDLAERMLATRGLTPALARDPWDRAITTETLVELGGLPEFEEWADEELGRRLSDVYRALRGTSGDSLSVADLEARVAAGKLRRSALVDPWGSPFRVVKGPRSRSLLGFRSIWVVVSSGPDRAPGTRDDLYPRFVEGAASCYHPPLQGVVLAEAYGSGFLAMGCGLGYGAGGYGRAASMPSVAVGSASRSSGEAAPIRRSFPETMLWVEALTDERGQATVPMTMADSITTWRLSADAIAADGRLGAASAEVRVFQDFFVDVDLPAAVTQGDELAVPVAVHNYLPSRQRVRVSVEPAAWFSLAGPGEQTLDLAPDQVAAVHFRIKARDVGPHRLLVRAGGQSAEDAVERVTQVHPDGVEKTVTFQARLGGGAASHVIDVPTRMIAGTPAASLKVYPSSATHALEGLDAILQMPGGCFEQTSSTTYPNLLVLDYLRRSGKSSPAVERKARLYIGAGYQRLLSFEVPGGGFSWFGDAPANQVLTAYGVEEFFDMTKVYPVDKRVIARTQAWLADQQQPDGGWKPDTNIIDDGVTHGLERDRTRITAYIGQALARTGGNRATVEKARAFVRRGVARGEVSDPYTIALVAQFLGPHDRLYPSLMEALWRSRKQEGDVIAFVATGKTPTRGDGKSAVVETTALAALAMMAVDGGGVRIDPVIGSLVGAKDVFGTWHSTQATIRSLQALLRYGELHDRRGTGKVDVLIDGERAGSVALTTTSDGLEVLDLPALTRPGRHKVELAFAGTGRIAYQLVARWHEPRPATPPPPQIAVAARIDDASVAVGESVRAEITVSARDGAPLDMLMVTAGLPPGFDPDGADLERLVADGVVEKVERTPRAVVFYLTGLPARKTLTLPLRLSPRFPLRVQMPAPTAWEYYRPEHRGDGAPLLVEAR